MKWGFSLTPEAKEDIVRLDKPVRRRVEEKLEWFIDHFDEVASSRLGFEFRGFLKLRVGDWRIVYEVKEEAQTVIIHNINHRSKVYKRR